MSGQRKRELPFNALAVNKAAALNGKTTEYSIEGERGLWLAVTPKGTATYVFRYDAPVGRTRSQRKKKIGRRDAVKLADARRIHDMRRRAPSAPRRSAPSCWPKPLRRSSSCAAARA